ncbi:hypothetical protein [uncultured Dokdonia sp.]|uniref:hypothetical protein n=1 Tax=uncultured Dokdonia sp. TaxID=575653 RepID=UPI0026106255|nr:hypothetical protein [uncultured Dokdonia sp.]
MSNYKYSIEIPSNLKDIIDRAELDSVIDQLLDKEIELSDGSVITYTLEDVQKILFSESELMTSLEVMNERDPHISSLAYNQGA